MAIPPKIRDLVLKRDGYECVLAMPGCGFYAGSCHHRANRRMGGASLLDDPRNLVATCYLCNGALEDASGPEKDEALRKGLRVLNATFSEQTLLRAEQMPVQYPNGEWYYLTADGRLKTHLGEN